MLFDERPELPGLAALDAEFVRTINEKTPERVEIYREEMDRSRFASNYQTLFRDFLRAKYADKKIDTVVAFLGPALDFLLDYGSEIFPGNAISPCKSEATTRLLSLSFSSSAQRASAPSQHLLQHSLNGRSERLPVARNRCDHFTTLATLTLNVAATWRQVCPARAAAMLPRLG